MSSLMGLNDIVFAERDPALIEQSIISRFEASWLEATGETISLYAGDPRRLLLLSAAYELALQRNLIDFTGKMNLLAYATGEYLDHIGALVGVKRLQDQAALTTMRLALSTILGLTYTVPAGIRFTPDGRLYFASEEAVDIRPGAKEIDIPVKCLVNGAIGNGFLPGQINMLVDPLPWVQSVSNITASAGGADVEDDESLRERIRLAPERFSVAGPTGAYEYWAKTTSAAISDVSVYSPDPGVVYIVPLLQGGVLPNDDILNAVYETCSDRTVRPLTDQVFVLKPTAAAYSIDLTYWIYSSDSVKRTAIQANIEQAVADYAAWQSEKLGRDINPSELHKRVMQAGAKRAVIHAPAFARLSEEKVAVLDTSNIVYGGLEDA